MTTQPRALAIGGAVLGTGNAQLLGPVPDGAEWAVDLRVSNRTTSDAFLTTSVGQSGPVRADNARIEANRPLDVERRLILSAGSTVWGYASAANTLSASWAIMERSAPSA